jgi:ABC-2 type transport system permease protein
MCSLRSLDAPLALPAPIRPLLRKELWDVVSGRALWTMLLILCPLIGYSLGQAIALYNEASGAALQSPALASGLSPLDGVLVPTCGAFYVAVTLLFPFVALRALGVEKESGALRLLIQLPYRAPTLIVAKLAAVVAAWVVSSIPVLSALVFWSALGGHLYGPETLNLLFGHLLYGVLVAAIALFAAAISDNAATAAIITLAFTIASWVLDFTAAGHAGILEWLSRLSLTQMLRTFEQGLLQARVVLAVAVGVCAFTALGAIWLPPGVPLRRKLISSAMCILAAAAALGLATQVKASIDVSEDRRNSFSPADQRALARLGAPLVITARFAPEDPRYSDLQRNLIAKLERTMPDVTVRLVAGRQTLIGAEADESYGEVEYAYGARRATSRSTSPREILPLLYGLADTPVPPPDPASDYPGYPLVANGQAAFAWFYGVGPVLIVAAWWWGRRPPAIPIGNASGRQS